MAPRTRVYLAVSLLLGPLLLGGCDGQDPDPLAGNSIAAVLSRDDDYASLVDALDEAELTGTLQGDGPFTLFAPTEDAFFYLGTPTREALLAPANHALLVRILRYHIVPRRLSAEDLTDGATFPTLDGTTVTVSRVGEAVFVDGAPVDLEEIIEADNGVIVPIKDVLRDNLDTASRLLLLPIASDFTGLLTDLGALSGIGEDSPVTLFAPINDAFRQLGDPTVELLEGTSNRDILERVVNFHVAPGRVRLSELETGAPIVTRDGATLTVTNDDGVLEVDGRRVIAPPVETPDGLIYLLDRLLLDDLDLYERLRISPDLVTFQTEVRDRPDLAALLSGSQEFTVFAPLTAGFENLDPNVRAALARPENAALYDRLIRIHIAVGRYAPEELVDRLALPTNSGYDLMVSRSGSDIFVGDKRVMERVELADNGILYRVPAPITPPADLVDGALLRGFTTHVEAIRYANLEATFRAAGPLTMFAFTNGVYQENPWLFGDPNLASILLYYGAGEIVDLSQPGTFQSLEGTFRTITIDPVLGPILDGVVPVGSYGMMLNGFLSSADTLGILPP